MAGKDVEDEAKLRFREYVKANMGHAADLIAAALEELYLAGWSASAEFYVHGEEHSGFTPGCRYCQGTAEPGAT